MNDQEPPSAAAGFSPIRKRRFSMANKASNQQADPWAEGMTKLSEAVRHNMTASTLAAAGVAALGAAAFAYLWDTDRRSNLFDSTRRFTEEFTSFWSRAGGSPSINQ
jgi:hypothetical protein